MRSRVLSIKQYKKEYMTMSLILFVFIAKDPLALFIQLSFPDVAPLVFPELFRDVRATAYEPWSLKSQCNC